MKNCSTLYVTLLILCLPFSSLFAQDCEGGDNETYLHGNNVRALLNNSGSLFMSKEGDASFQIPFVGEDSRNTIFGQGLWLGGTSPAGSLHLSAQTYGYVNGTNQAYDYLPGPLDENGNLPANCEDWDKVWSVTRFDIEQHRADYAEDNTIDTPLEAVFAWPGNGNPHFAAYNGFELPATDQGFAPFFDNNADGVYDPMAGDYPMIEQSDTIPQQIAWTVFNDLGMQESMGTPLQFEVQLTSWALLCGDNDQLNNSIFNSFKVINRSNAAIDSLHLGLWSDFDLGCYTDDYIGSAPELNTVYVYNSTNSDALECPPAIGSYGLNPPVQAVTVLNKGLQYFMHYYNASSSPFPGAVSPQEPADYFNLLTGRWVDGTPLTEGGDGYDPSGINPPTNFAFPDDPNDPDGWSQVTAETGVGDVRAVASIALGLLDPGESQTVDFGYSYFRITENDHLENVTAMYDGVANLQTWYDTRFADQCSEPDFCEEGDCIWPGDTNADGIANHCDLLPIGLQITNQGATRPGALIWAPDVGTDWANSQFDGTNAKHIDANGDGMIDPSDFEITMTHYNKTTPDYTGTDQYTEGPELFAVPAGSLTSFDNLEAGDNGFVTIRVANVPNLYGIAFSLEYDPRYLESLEPLTDGFNPNTMQYLGYYPEDGLLEFSKIAKDGETLIEENEVLFPVQLHVQPDLSMPLPSDTSYIRFKNIKGVRPDGSPIELGGTTAVLTFQGITVATEEAVREAFVIDLFPNPARELLTIQAEGKAIEAFQMITPTGQEVHSQAGLSEPQIQLPVGHLPKGLYLIRIYIEDQWTVRKVILE
jgi:hypothetical protein